MRPAVGHVAVVVRADHAALDRADEGRAAGPPGRPMCARPRVRRLEGMTRSASPPPPVPPVPPVAPHAVAPHAVAPHAVAPHRKGR
ncbi:hypothetical protein C8046_15855 [Serinibacter arcticus]|uniref:Uncharacterized protein n=1 Tax=Serinibacter arcticus TaxID=1655435 RepID=A0A2U1ZY31_9MICO|nr:hypothetical protein C8046_15855 [Serinibacter arcticus]